MTDTVRVNIPGRVISFYQGGEAWIEYEKGIKESRNLTAGEYELFHAVACSRRRTAKGGYWHTVYLTPAGIEAARYWAETLATASADDASWEPDLRNDLRAARKLLRSLEGEVG